MERIVNSTILELCDVDEAGAKVLTEHLLTLLEPYIKPRPSLKNLRCMSSVYANILSSCTVTGFLFDDYTGVIHHSWCEYETLSKLNGKLYSPEHYPMFMFFSKIDQNFTKMELLEYGTSPALAPTYLSPEK